MTDLLEVPIVLNAERQIIHVDMDAFYAQVEIREHPEYRNEILIIGSDPRKNGGRGVVATANYAARRLGVHSAMSSNEALKLAPEAHFVQPDFKLYKTVSKQVHAIFHRYTDLVEPVAFDEAYLDVTGHQLNFASSVELAHHLQQTIYEELNLTSSVGVSFNKFLAKLASEHNKPAGFTLVGPADVRVFLDALPIADVRGVGRKTLPVMHQLGIYTGRDLFEQNQTDLATHFGKLGYDLYLRIRGVDDRQVQGNRQRKSLGNERTYGPPLDNEEAILDALRELAMRLQQDLIQAHFHCKTIVLKMRDDDFKTETRRITETDFIMNQVDVLYNLALDLWEEMGGYQQPIRLLGLTAQNLAPVTFDEITLDLYGE
ncbi:DNA polymerase IV [Weissella kandleri]|uniref:DNA polymerase IV n=1 Tax=Weissella kandleri TaxID=1616 RepID=UPI00387E2B1A